MTTAAQRFAPYSSGEGSILSPGFVERWKDAIWTLEDGDRKAAARLHVELTSRITTQRLGYLDGVEKAALDSLHSLFELTRDICAAEPLARHFETIAWDVLNTHVRPFTAKWHSESERGALTALDRTDQFRAELAGVQMVLRRFDDLLLELRDGGLPAPRPDDSFDERARTIGKEMEGSVSWGIPQRIGGIDDAEIVKAINEAEAEAIRERRNHYHEPHATHAVGLALSGGGIRSATFGLGVLAALAQRGVLPQIDYLSTVSGGGYLGAFLSAFLRSPDDPSEDNVGLRSDQLPFRRRDGEAIALRHIRHHSKYLLTGSFWRRLSMVGAQLYGMLLNGLAVLYLAAVFVIGERALRSIALPGVTLGAAVSIASIVVGGVMVVALAVLRFVRRRRSAADRLVTSAFIVLATLVVWSWLESVHAWVAAGWHLPWTSSWKIDQKSVLAVFGAVPAITAALSSVFGRRLLSRAGRVLLVLAGISAPLFFFGIYLTIYNWASTTGTMSVLGIGAVSRSVVLLIAAVSGTLAYLFLLDVNATSPHRQYRDKLAEAYVIQANGRGGVSFGSDVDVRLSALASKPHRGPYHLINCALNVPGSTNAAMQGRRTDFFMFSSRYCGSPITGYRETRDWETADRQLDLATAMAISGGAAAPQMGLGTVPQLSFWLALLNIRLGYWLRHPDRKPRIPGSAPGLRFLLAEMLGNMSERSVWLNVSDGGHIENLGVYELLRRRCKYIIVVDGEQDSKMAFHAFATLQRLAEIDLGVRIEANLDDLRLNAQALSRSHFRFCRIHYPTGDRAAPAIHGYLLYVKLSLTGNEGEFIRRYRLDEPAFPHQSTADQFFSEEQFEAYRSLGEHIGDRLFLPGLAGEFANPHLVSVEQWFRQLGTNLLDPLPA